MSTSQFSSHHCSIFAIFKAVRGHHWRAVLAQRTRMRSRYGAGGDTTDVHRVKEGLVERRPGPRRHRIYIRPIRTLAESSQNLIIKGGNSNSVDFQVDAVIVHLDYTTRTAALYLTFLVFWIRPNLTDDLNSTPRRHREITVYTEQSASGRCFSNRRCSNFATVKDVADPAPGWFYSAPRLLLAAIGQSTLPQGSQRKCRCASGRTAG